MTLIALVLAIPLSSARISATLYTRIVAIAFLFAALLSYNIIPSVSQMEGQVPSTTEALGGNDAIDAGLGLYSGLIHATTITQTIEVFLLVVGALILLP
jgi:hypothetical protein